MTHLLFLLPMFGLMGLGALGLWLRGQWELDDYEADLVGLAAQGLRVRTDSDVADIAYRKMQQMLSKASRGRTSAVSSLTD